MSLRTRVLLSFLPLVLLLAALGAVGLVQLDRTGGRIDAIMRENYASVQAMFRLNESLERMDSSFQFALSAREATKEKEARDQFVANWRLFEEQFHIEENNITIHPAEDELAARLRPLQNEYRKRGAAFFSLPPGSAERVAAYYGWPGDRGLLGLFRDIKEVSGEILRINRENMEQARDDARATARRSLIGFGAGLAVLAAVVAGIAWYLLRTILTPIRAVTEAAHGIGESAKLDREVPVHRRDELGRLAEAFNAMIRQLRTYRRTNLDRLLRAQRTTQAAIDSFPIHPRHRPRGKVEPREPGRGRARRRPAGGEPAPRGSRPNHCGTRSPRRCGTSTRTSPKGSTRSFLSGSGTKTARISRRCGRSATRTATRSARPSFSTT